MTTPSQDSGFESDWMLSHYLSLGYRREDDLVGKEDGEFSLGHVDSEVSKKQLCVSIHVCPFSRWLDMRV